jgi:hypothetical protein
MPSRYCRVAFSSESFASKATSVPHMRGVIVAESGAEGRVLVHVKAQ